MTNLYFVRKKISVTNDTRFPAETGTGSPIIRATLIFKMQKD